MERTPEIAGERAGERGPSFQRDGAGGRGIHGVAAQARGGPQAAADEHIAHGAVLAQGHAHTHLRGELGLGAEGTEEVGLGLGAGPGAHPEGGLVLAEVAAGLEAQALPTLDGGRVAAQCDGDDAAAGRDGRVQGTARRLAPRQLGLPGLLRGLRGRRRHALEVLVGLGQLRQGGGLAGERMVHGHHGQLALHLHELVQRGDPHALEDGIREGVQVRRGGAVVVPHGLPVLVRLRVGDIHGLLAVHADLVGLLLHPLLEGAQLRLHLGLADLVLAAGDQLLHQRDLLLLHPQERFHLGQEDRPRLARVGVHHLGDLLDGRLHVAEAGGERQFHHLVELEALPLEHPRQVEGAAVPARPPPVQLRDPHGELLVALHQLGHPSLGPVPDPCEALRLAPVPLGLGLHRQVRDGTRGRIAGTMGRRRALLAPAPRGGRPGLREHHRPRVRVALAQGALQQLRGLGLPAPAEGDQPQSRLRGRHVRREPERSLELALRLGQGPSVEVGPAQVHGRQGRTRPVRLDVEEHQGGSLVLPGLAEADPQVVGRHQRLGVPLEGRGRGIDRLGREAGHIEHCAEGHAVGPVQPGPGLRIHLGAVTGRQPPQQGREVLLRGRVVRHGHGARDPGELLRLDALDPGTLALRSPGLALRPRLQPLLVLGREGLAGLELLEDGLHVRGRGSRDLPLEQDRGQEQARPDEAANDTGYNHGMGQHVASWGSPGTGRRAMAPGRMLGGAASSIALRSSPYVARPPRGGRGGPVSRILSSPGGGGRHSSGTCIAAGL